MRSSLKHILLFVSLFICGQLLFAQQNKTDSLINVLLHAQADTNKVKNLNTVAWEIKDSNLDTALILGKQALDLAEKLKWTKGLAIAERQFGWFNSMKSLYEPALEHYQKALVLCQLLISSEDKAIQTAGKNINGRTLGNIGSLYRVQANYPKALEYYLKALKISEELGDKQQIGRCLSNIGNVYSAQDDKPKALEFYLRGLKLAEEIGDKQGVGTCLSYIGNVYFKQDNYPKANEYYLKGLKMAEEMGDKRTEGTCLGNIGYVYQIQANYPKAIDYYLRALKISEEIGDKQQAGRWLGGLGNLNLQIAKYTVAEEYIKRALILAKELGALDIEKTEEEDLSWLYEKTNRPALAFEHYKRYIALRDTIFSEENSKKLLRTEMKHDFEKKEAVLKEQQEKERAIAKEKSKFQQIVIATVIFGLILVIVFAIFVFRTLKTTRKQKVIIEEKQKEIIDSITYARRIQRALITNENYIDKSLKKLQDKSKE